jgi:hypothetical protein
VLLFGCASAKMIPGTKIPDNDENRGILKVVERYRQAMERRDATMLMALAHPWYTENSATGNGEFDYGYEGLKKVIQQRLAPVRAVRYGIAYKSLSRNGNRAYVEVFIDASYQMTTEMGDRWERKTDDNRFELLWDGKSWRFLSGM